MQKNTSKPIYKKWWFLTILAVVASVLLALFFGETEEPVDTEPKTNATSSEKQVSAKDWVKEHQKENIDKIISAYNKLDDSELKSKLTESVADSDETLFGKEVTVTGTAKEFVEGSDGITKASFLVKTPNDNIIRISAKGDGNEALDIGEQVEIIGILGTPIDSNDILVREASVYIK